MSRVLFVLSAWCMALVLPAFAADRAPVPGPALPPYAETVASAGTADSACAAPEGPEPEDPNWRWRLRAYRDLDCAMSIIEDALNRADASGRASSSPSSQPGSVAPVLVGTWVSKPDEIRLTSDFDRSVWGPDASSVRTAELTIRPSGEATLTVTRKVVDAGGKTVAGSASIEEAHLIVGGSEKGVANRVDHLVTVVKAERRYPDDPDQRWPIDGLRVKVVTFEGEDNDAIEIRFDAPDGRGSFWDTLARQGKDAPRA